MALNIPMPNLDRNGIFEGLIAGNQIQDRRRQMQQDWQQHLSDLAIKQQQQERLAEEFELVKQLHPFKLQALQQTATNQSNLAPLNLDLLRAKIESQHALTKQREAPRTYGMPGTQNDLKRQRAEQIINSHNWSLMPPTAKENLIARGNDLGIRPDELVQGMASGKTFDQIANEHGFGTEEAHNAAAKYLPTSQNVTRENTRQKNLAELNVLEKHVSDAMAPYISTYFDYSPKQVADAFGGKNQDDLAKYLAARALQPELASLRIKAMEGNIGQGAIEEIVHSALGKSKILQSQVTPQVYRKMNHYINDWIGEGSKAATESIYGKSNKSQSAPKNESRKRFNPVTGMVE
jgi:hypothetical protein